MNHLSPYSIKVVFRDYEVNGIIDLFMLRGLRRGDVKRIEFNWMSIPLLVMLIPFILFFSHNIVALILFVLLPFLFSVYGVPIFLRTLKRENLNIDGFRLAFALSVSYALLLFLWFLFTYSVCLLISMLPIFLEVVIDFLGLDSFFAAEILLLLVALFIVTTISISIVSDVYCRYGLNMSLERIILDAFIIPLYLLIVVVNALLELALYLSYRDFFVYNYIMLRERLKDFYNDFFYIEKGRCRKLINESSVGLEEKYKEVSRDYKEQLKLELRFRVGKGLTKWEIKPQFRDKFNDLFGLFDRGFKTINDAKEFTKKYYMLIYESDTTANFLKKYLLSLLIFSPIFLLIAVSTLQIHGMLNVIHYLMVLIISILYPIEIILYEKINLKKFRRRKFPLLFNSVIQGLQISTIASIFLITTLILFYSIITRDLIGIATFTATTIILALGHSKIRKTNMVFLGYEICLYFTDVNVITLMLYNSNLEETIKILKSSYSKTPL